MFGEKAEHKVTLEPLQISSSMDTSVERLLDVVHFSVKVKPCDGRLYFDSKVPEIWSVSREWEVLVVNSYKNISIR